MKVAYVFEQFPCRSETFALREIECLRRRGLEITVLCARRGDFGMNEQVRIVAAPKRYSRHWLGAFAHLAIRRWKRLPGLAALWWRIAICSPRRGLRMLRDLPAMGRFARAMDAQGICHVHGYWLGWPVCTAAALSVLTGSTMSLSAHARDIFTETATLDIPARRAKFIAVCTQQGLHQLRKVLGPNLSSKLHIVRHGLLPQELAAFKGRDLSSLRLVAIGRLVEKKGFDVLVNAFGQVRQRCEGVRLTIIGDGPLERSLKELAGRLSLDGSITFAGWLPHDETMNRIRQANMLIVSSVIASDGDRDGVPNVILEAFSCGTPVVASRLPGIEEAVEHETTGLLAAPGDMASLAETIFRLIQDRELAASLARGGRRVLEERFDAMANSGQLAKLFAKAMRQS